MMKVHTYLVISLYMLIVRGCDKPHISDQRINAVASIPANFGFASYHLKVMCTQINRRNGTMATLYANDKAISAFKGERQRSAPGFVLILVTWRQQANPYWFGSNIPDSLQTLEILKPGTDTGQFTYALFEGKDLRPAGAAVKAEERIKYMLSLKPSVMP